MSFQAEKCFQKNKGNKNTYRNEFKKLLEDESNLKPYFLELLRYGLVPSQSKWGLAPPQEQNKGKLKHYPVLNLLETFNVLKPQLLLNKLDLYKVKVLYISMTIHHANIVEQSLHFMKKTLTLMYTPNKDEEEKEGEFYKLVQEMVINKSPEIDVIWQFVIGSSLKSYSESQLTRIANLTDIEFTFASNRSMAGNTTNAQDSTLMSQTSTHSSIVHSLIDDTFATIGNESIRSKNSNTQTGKQQEHDESTNINTQSFGNQSQGCILASRTDLRPPEQPPSGSFAKRPKIGAEILDSSSILNHTTDSKVLKDVLIAHSRVRY